MRSSFPGVPAFRRAAVLEEGADFFAAIGRNPCRIEPNLGSGPSVSHPNQERFNAPRREVRPAGYRKAWRGDRKSTRLNSSHVKISYAVFCLKKKKRNHKCTRSR